MLLLPPPNPPVVSLFSADLYPHPTWSSRTDPALPDDSLIVLLPSPSPSLPAGLIHRSLPRTDIAHLALHIQSPTVQKTSLRCPATRDQAIGVELAWLNLHLARLGRRELAVECIIRDGQGVEGRVRCGTFTTEAHITYSSNRPPLLHLPLRFPSSSPSSSSAPVLTAWSHLALSLPTLLAHFSSPLLTAPPPSSSSTPARRPMHHQRLPDVRASRGACWLAVEVFANCRLRRVWFAAERASGVPERGVEELALFAAEAVEGEGERGFSS